MTFRCRSATGEAVAIVGANGAGKTTLVRTICGLLRARSGQHREERRRHQPRFRRTTWSHHRIAVVLENRRLFGELTVRENLLLAENAAARTRRPQGVRLERYLRALPHDRGAAGNAGRICSAAASSRWWRSRARCLLQPDLLIMDEPSTGLAPKVVKDILQVIKALRGRGMALLLVEQNVGIAADITDRAYVLALGRIEHEIQPGAWDAFLKDERLVKAYLGWIIVGTGAIWSAHKQ